MSASARFRLGYSNASTGPWTWAAYDTSIDVTAGQYVKVQLESTTGVNSFTASVFSADPTEYAAGGLPTVTVDNATKTAVFRTRAAATNGATYLVKATVNGGLITTSDRQRIATANYEKSLAVHILTPAGNRLIAVAETTESDRTYGFLPKLNTVITTGIVNLGLKAAGVVRPTRSYLSISGGLGTSGWSSDATNNFLTLALPTKINVKDPPYSAAGDDATDDTTAIRAAIAALPASGGIIFFPAGTYKITGALTITSGIELQGQGRDVTIIKNYDEDGSAIIATGPTARQITIRSLSVEDGVSATRTAGIGVDLNGNGDALIAEMRQVRITGHIECLKLRDLIHSAFVDVRATAAACTTTVIHVAVGANYSTSTAFERVYAEGATFAVPWVVDQLLASSFNNCIAEGSPTEGFKLGYSGYACRSISIECLEAEGNTGRAFCAYGVRNLALKQCFLYESDPDRCLLECCTNVSIDTTEFYSSTPDADSYDIAACRALISDASNAAPIEITTTRDHGLSTGAVVVITNVGGNTAANNTVPIPTWTITKTADNKFTLDTSDGTLSGSYTSATGEVNLSLNVVRSSDQAYFGSGTVLDSRQTPQIFGWKDGILTVQKIRPTITTASRTQPASAGQDPQLRWTFNAAVGMWMQSDIAGVGALWIPLSNLIDKANLSKIVVRLTGKWTGAAGHVGLPATLPTVTVYRQDDASLLDIGPTVTDPSASALPDPVAAYDAPHDIEVPITSGAGVDEEGVVREYKILITGEGGLNSIVDTTTILSVSAQYTDVIDARAGG